MTNEVERVVMCRTCGGKGKYSPEFDEAITLIQRTWDAGNIDTLIDNAIVVMKVKKSKREHTRRLLQTFCRIAERFDGI